jgi:hypothetical protein
MTGARHASSPMFLRRGGAGIPLSVFALRASTEKPSPRIKRGSGAPGGATFLVRAFIGERTAPHGAPQRLSRWAVALAAQLQARASWDVASSAVSRLRPVPVQRAPRRGVIVPPGRIPEPPRGGVCEAPPAGAASVPTVMTPHDSALVWNGQMAYYHILGIKSTGNVRELRMLFLPFVPAKARPQRPSKGRTRFPLARERTEYVSHPKQKPRRFPGGAFQRR